MMALSTLNYSLMRRTRGPIEPFVLSMKVTNSIIWTNVESIINRLLEQNPINVDNDDTLIAGVCGSKEFPIDGYSLQLVDLVKNTINSHETLISNYGELKDIHLNYYYYPLGRPQNDVDTPCDFNKTYTDDSSTTFCICLEKTTDTRCELVAFDDDEHGGHEITGMIKGTIIRIHEGYTFFNSITASGEIFLAFIRFENSTLRIPPRLFRSSGYSTIEDSFTDDTPPPEIYSDIEDISIISENSDESFTIISHHRMLPFITL